MSDFMEEASFVPDYEEDMEEDTKPMLCMPKPKKLSGRKCPLCTARTTAVKPHVLRAHLPWYFGLLEMWGSRGKALFFASKTQQH